MGFEYLICPNDVYREMAYEFASIPVTVMWFYFFSFLCMIVWKFIDFVGSQSHHKVRNGGWELVETTELGLTSAVESNIRIPLGMAVELPSPPYLEEFLAHSLPWPHLLVLTLPSVGPNIPPCWILECLSESKPKPRHLAILGSCWIGFRRREPPPSTPN